jgi:hypothetical protein
VRIIGAAMRVFSYVFHIILALFLLGVSSLAWISGMHTLKVGVLPWREETLTFVLFGGALLGIASVLLAYFGVFRVLFFAWSLVVVGILLKGFVFSSFSFRADGDFHTALCLTVGALLAALGAWSAFRKPACS